MSPQLTILIFLVDPDWIYAKIYPKSDPGILLMFHGNVKFSPNFTRTGLLQLKVIDSPLAETLEKVNHASGNKETFEVDYSPVFFN